MSPKMRSLGQVIEEARVSADLTQEELARALGLSRAAVNNWELDKNLPARKHIKALCEALALETKGITDIIFDPTCGTGGFLVSALQSRTKTSEDISSGKASDRQKRSHADKGTIVATDTSKRRGPRGLQLERLRRDLPVYSSNPHSDAAVDLDLSHPVERHDRPPYLIGAPDAFAVITATDEMEPRYFRGELLYAHPGRPAAPGDFVIVEFINHRGCIRRLHRLTPTIIELERFKPRAIERHKRGEILFVSKILGTGPIA